MKTKPGTPLEIWNQANHLWKGAHKLQAIFSKGSNTKTIHYSYITDIPTKTGDGWILESVEDEKT